MRKKRRIALCAAAAPVLAAAVLTAVFRNSEALFPVKKALHTGAIENLYNNYAFSVDTGSLGRTLPNVKSNMNRYGGRFPENPVINAEYNPYDFTEYIQLMECTGGNPARDLFRDPENYDVTDDYELSALIASCRGILKTGAKPLLKLGNVPNKLSKNVLKEYASESSFDVNVYPPDDYEAYYDYIRAVIGGLAEAFGPEEVRSWRFGVFTEYENADWFHAPGDDPQESMEAFCKLYDHTVQALIDELGPEVFVGAHSMSVSDGLWNEADFIMHCGRGKNYATGKTGTRICYLSASYYEVKPGEFGKNQRTLPQIMQRLGEAAEAAGLTDLLYGIDEGRILVGVHPGADSDQLPSRTVGDTYQAAFDARLVKQAFDTGLDWFSNWEYCAEGDNHGVPLISCHLARLAAGFKGARLAGSKTLKKGLLPRAEVEVSAAFNEETNTLRLMAYNYKNSLYYVSSADITAEISAPQLAGQTVTVTEWRLNDDCNWFDEWREERRALGITDDMFAWSPDDGCPNWKNEAARETFLSLSEKHMEYARLTPQSRTAEVSAEGLLTLTDTLGPNNVLFFEIRPAE